MRKLFILLTIMILSTVASAQYTYQIVLRNAAAPNSATSANIIGSGAAFHNLTWNVSGTVSTCSVRVDGSADGITWGTGDVIGATTCTSNGNTLSASHIVNYVRINLVTFTGTLPVFTANVSGYITQPSGGGTVTSVTCGTGLTGGTITSTGTCAADTTVLATKADLAGVNPAVAVQVATTAAANTSGLTYSNGVAGIGATFTGTVNTALTFDGVTLTSLNQRVLVKDDTQSPSGAFNGVYYLTQLQTGILAPVLTRALDYNQPGDMNNTGAIPVVSGTVNSGKLYVQSSQVTTVGTDPVTFTQFASGGGATIGYGSYASLPGTCAHSSTSSDLYFSTDGPYQLVCGATNTWSAFFQGFKITVPPTCGSLTILGSGQTSASCSTSTGPLVLYTQGPTACCNNYAAVQTAPSTPYIIDVSYVFSNTSTANTNTGIMFRDSASTKATAFEFYNGAFRVEYWSALPATGASTDGSTLATGNPIAGLSNVYRLRIQDNGTNRIYSWSQYSEGDDNWNVFYTESRTTNFTANQIGFVSLAWGSSTNYTQSKFYDVNIH